MLNLFLSFLPPLCFFPLFPQLNPSSSLSFQLYLPISLSLSLSLCSFPLLRHAACSPGGVGGSGEESRGLRSSPALGGQLLFIQPETQAGSASAPGRTLHRQVRNTCKHTEISTSARPQLAVETAAVPCLQYHSIHH